MNDHDDQHDKGEGKMGNMPILEEFLHGLQSVNPAVQRYFILHKLHDLRSLESGEMIVFQGPLYSSYACSILPASQGWFNDGIKAILIKGIFGDKYVSDICFQTTYFIQAQLPAFDGPWYLYIYEPADDATEDDCDHAPETDCNQSPNFKGSMKNNQYGTYRAQENMEFQPVL